MKMKRNSALVANNIIWSFKPVVHSVKSAISLVGVGTLKINLNKDFLKDENKWPHGIDSFLIKNLIFLHNNIVIGTALVCGKEFKKVTNENLSSSRTPPSKFVFTIPQTTTITTTTSDFKITTPYVFDLQGRCNGPSGVLPISGKNINPNSYKPMSYSGS